MIGDLYQYDFENKKCSLIVISEKNEIVEYKLMNDDGSFSRRIYSITRELWDRKPDNLEKYGHIELMEAE